MARKKAGAGPAPPLFVISGGDGASGSQLVQTALAQFPDSELEIEVIANVTTSARLRNALTRVAGKHGSVVHTLVDDELRRELVRRARELHVPQIDAMGRVMRRLSTLLGREPLEQPGRYRTLRGDYFDRVEAIEFAVRHDDGQGLADLPGADIVLVGVSRTGKTPLAMYLSVQGWKVANVPYVGGIRLPAQLKEVERDRVVGLVIDPARLRQYRDVRSRKLRMDPGSGYATVRHIREEVDASVRVFRRRGFAVVDVTDRPIEEIAEAVQETVTERLRRAASRAPAKTRGKGKR